MKFYGDGIVKRKGKTIALFVDGEFETVDESTIDLLLQLGYPTEKIEKIEIPVVNNIPKEKPAKPEGRNKVTKAKPKAKK